MSNLEEFKKKYGIETRTNANSTIVNNKTSSSNALNQFKAKYGVGDYSSPVAVSFPTSIKNTPTQMSATPTFKTPEEALAYAKQNNIKVTGNTNVSPKIAGTSTQPKTISVKPPIDLKNIKVEPSTAGDTGSLNTPKYQEMKNKKNVLEESAKTFGKGALVGTTNIYDYLNAQSDLGARVTNTTKGLLNIKYLYNYDPNAQNLSYKERLKRGQIASANALGQLEVLANKSESLKELYNQIKNGTFKGTEEDLERAIYADELEQIEKDRAKTQWARDMYAEQIEKNEQLGPIAGRVANAFGTVGNMVPTIGATMINPALGQATLFANSAGGAYNEAIENGALPNEASLNATLTGGLELATEAIGGEKISKLTGVPTLTKKLGFTPKGAIGKILLEIGSEEVEELVNTAVQPLINKMTYEKNAPMATKEDYWNTFVDTALSTVLLMGLSDGISAVNNYKNTTIEKIEESNMTSEQKKQAKAEVQKGANEIIEQLKKQNNTNLAQTSPNNEQISQNNVQNVSNLEKTVQSEQSLGIQQNKEIPQVIQTFVENRNKTAPGLNIQFDSALNTDGRIIRKPDGTRTISINPNSTRAYEFVVVHEMMHDLENTQEFQELSKYVRDRAIAQEGFEKAKKAITEQYTKYYTENNLDMSGLNMDVETTNDMVAQALGNQQFLNELAGQKPNVFMRLYNWIKNVAFDGNNTGKTFSERRADNKYLQELKNKFEQAYNTAYNNANAQNNYSIAGQKGLRNAINNDARFQRLEDNLNRAQLMAQNNIDNETIRNKTNWFQDKNGDWKFEFSDKDMALKRGITLEENKNYKLEDILEHDILFLMYPELRNYNIKFVEKKNTSKKGEHDASTRTISVNSKLMERSNWQELIEGTLIHELQHAIQNIEGFEKGKSSFSKTAYYNSLGEIEADDVKNRLLLEKYYGEKNISNIAPESSKANPMHSRSYKLNNLTTVDKIKDKIYNSFEKYMKGKNDSYEETIQENNRENIQLNKQTNNVGRRVKGLEESSSFSLGQNLPKTDNRGRELSKGQQERFENSKARDKNNNLVRMYHTTGAYTSIPQFNEFDPRGDEHYKFDNQIVNYYTDSKEMSGSYADQNYEMADTRKITSIDDVNMILSELNSEDESVQFKLDKNKLAIDIYDDQIEIIHDFLLNLKKTDKNIHNEFLNAVMLSRSASELSDKINANPKLEQLFYTGLLHEIDSKTKNKWGYVTATNILQKLLDYDGIGGAVRTIKFKNENDLFRNLKSRIQTEAPKYLRRNHWQYEGYADIQNPYIIDAQNTNWNKIDEGNVNEEGKKIQKTLDLLEKNNLTYTLKRLINKAEYTNKKMNEQLMEYQKKATDAQEAILNWYARNGNIDEIFDKSTLYNEQFLEEIKTHMNDKIDGRSLKEIGLEFYNNKYKNYLKNEFNKLKQEHSVLRNLSLEELEILADIHFDESELKFKYKKLSQTNDIVKRIIEYNNKLIGDTENKNHTQEEILKAGGYDGIIIKNVYDYGGESDTQTPNDLYITFASNQFKAIDNTNPTDDPDIRYSQSNNEWQNYLDKNWDLMPNAKKSKPTLPTQAQQQADQEAKRSKIPKLEDIADLTQKDADLPSMKYRANKDKNTAFQRKFFENMETSKIISDKVKEQVTMTTYEQKKNLETLEKAKENLDTDINKVASEWFRKDIKKATDEDVALGAILVERYQQEGMFEEAVDVVQKLADMGTEAGRTVQMYSIFQRLTPEGMMVYQQRKLNSALETLTQKQTGKWVEQNKDKFKLTEDDATFITAKVQEAQNAPTERQKQIALAEIEARINDKLPPEAGQSVKAFRRIAMLFNPKTQVRNIVGNMTVMPLNYVTDLVATGIDKAVAKKTGIRTTALPNVKTIAKGAKKGLYETIDDYKRGIRTTPTGSKYEIQNNVKSFKNKKMNAIDRLLSSVMEAGDRPFYEASYQNALEGQMKANSVTEPTQEMIDIASNVALSQTWQDNNNYTQAVLGIRFAFNKININGFGLGDLIIPFAKTPANLTKAMVDYSPAGLIPSIINYNDMRKAISRGDMTATQQKKFVTSVGKAVAGTILYTIAGALAKGGGITGSSDEDKDVANFEKNVLGIQPYSIKIGDKTFTYNWAQPLATPLAIMSDTYKMSEEGAKWNEILVNAFKVAGDQLVANSFLQGIQELLSSEYGNESAMDNLVGAIMDLPTQFTPTLFGQIATQFDSTKRQTFENGDTVGTMWNEVKNKLPGAKNTLAPQVNTFGEEIKNYGGDNNPFNVFLNPGNISSTNATDTQKELYKLYQDTKDKTIFPAQAPYSVSGGGEKVTLSSQDRADYQKTTGKFVSDNLEALFNSEYYKSLDNDKKAEVVNEIVTDANTLAKGEYLETKASKELKEKLSKLGDIPYVEYYNAWSATRGIESDKNWKGESISGSKKKKQIQAINNATSKNLTNKQRETLYGLLNVSGY